MKNNGCQKQKEQAAPSVLFMLHIPPPIHGSAVMGQIVRESTLVNSNFSCSYFNLLASKEVDNSGKITIAKLTGMVKNCFSLFGILLQGKPNLCYYALTTTGAAFYRDTFLIFILKCFRVKLVFHLHNKGVSQKQDRLINCLLYKKVFKRTKVILLSNLLYPDILKFVSRSDTYTLPNGISDAVGQAPPKKLMTAETISILFLSNLFLSKGVLVLLRACSILKDRQVNFQCLFVGGDGDLSGHNLKEEINALCLEDKVKYLGRKVGPAKTQVLQMADIFAFPTENDCFPLVLLEAMQHTLPVISTNEGGVSDIVADKTTGFIIPQNDPVALADQLELLIRDHSLRVKMGGAGRERYESLFTKKHFEKGLVSILNDILQKNEETRK